MDAIIGGVAGFLITAKTLEKLYQKNILTIDEVYDILTKAYNSAPDAQMPAFKEAIKEMFPNAPI